MRPTQPKINRERGCGAERLGRTNIPDLIYVNKSTNLWHSCFEFYGRVAKGVVPTKARNTFLSLYK